MEEPVKKSDNIYKLLPPLAFYGRMIESFLDLCVVVKPRRVKGLELDYLPAKRPKPKGFGRANSIF